MSVISSLNKRINSVKQRPAVAAFLDRIPNGPKVQIRSMLDRLGRPGVHQRINAETHQANTILARMLYEQAQQHPRFAEPGRLLKHGFKIYSQHDEDGIIVEIFRRIGTTNKTFIEFGAGEGIENCTLHLLLLGWTGAWIDASAWCYEDSMKRLDFLIREKRLRIKHAFVSMENIESLFNELGVHSEPDLLSIDIDSNDYWVWSAIQAYRPRAIVIEYNATFGPSAAVTIPYNGRRIWDLSNYSGASLRALQLLGEEKGYSLVGCNYTGVSAFFVRNDLIQPGMFLEPFTAETHWEPARYYCRMPNGHIPSFGAVVDVDRQKR